MFIKKGGKSVFMEACYVLPFIVFCINPISYPILIYLMHVEQKKKHAISEEQRLSLENNLEKAMRIKSVIDGFTYAFGLGIVLFFILQNKTRLSQSKIGIISCIAFIIILFSAFLPMVAYYLKDAANPILNTISQKDIIANYEKLFSKTETIACDIISLLINKPWEESIVNSAIECVIKQMAEDDRLEITFRDKIICDLTNAYIIYSQYHCDGPVNKHDLQLMIKLILTISKNTFPGMLYLEELKRSSTNIDKGSDGITLADTFYLYGNPLGLLTQAVTGCISYVSRVDALGKCNLNL